MRLVRKAIAVFLVIVPCVCAHTAIAQNAAARGLRLDLRGRSALAIDALFVKSDLESARRIAKDVDAGARRRGLGPRIQSSVLLDALFVEMEAAALQGDTRAELQAALRICESGATDNDPRVSIASSHIIDLAANTPDFRAVVPRIKNVIGRSRKRSSDLRAALLMAAADGVPGLSEIQLARESGLITDWNIVGPFGRFSNVAFEQAWAPEQDGLSRTSYDGKSIEKFQFPTGEVTIPEYFPMGGVFYAAGQVTIPRAGTWIIRVESPGTIQVWIDGKVAVTKDDRFEPTPETVGTRIMLQPGRHRVIAKFLPSATPFRISILPVPRRARSDSIKTDIDADYLAAAQAFWAGDYGEAVRVLRNSRAKHESAVVDLLLAQALRRAGENGAETIALLNAALKFSPSAHAAGYELATVKSEQGDTEAAFQIAQRVYGAQPEFEPAVQLSATLAVRAGRRDIAQKAWAAEIAIHPSCSVLKDAVSFFESSSDFHRARETENKLQGCAPGSTAWVEALARSGHHQEAAEAAQRIVAAYPLDRGARELLVRELSMAGNLQSAKLAAHELVAIAPNSDDFRKMAAQLDRGDEVLDAVAADEDFTAMKQFYSTYRRNAEDVLRETADRKSWGGQAVVILNDRVVRVNPNGSAAIYVHKITRILDRGGLARYGEAGIPEGAEVLELCTIKADGNIVEPEFTQNKSTVSMPALSPGDAIEIEYVIRDLDGGTIENPDQLEFAFGSFNTPIMLSRFVVISVRGAKLQFVPFGEVPDVNISTSDEAITRIWERNDIPQWISEVSMPRDGVLPSVSIFREERQGWAGVRDFYRDEFIGAIRRGRQIEEAAQKFTGNTDEERLRAAYRFVTSRIRRDDTDYDSGEIQSAENTLRNFSGSPTATLLAIAKEMGIAGEIMMARDISSQRPVVASVHAYNHPLLVFHLRTNGESRDVVVDAETEGMRFGGVAATLARKDALVVPVYQVSDASPIASVPEPIVSERSIAEGDINFSEDGDLTAHLTIKMGAARGAQMRRTLRGIDSAGRRSFFEQLAGRIFPGVISANGQIENEFDPDRPLTLAVDCRASSFVKFSRNLTELEQLVPALGLKSMYSTMNVRRTPLLIETPLVEVTSFRIHLPRDMNYLPRFKNVEEQSEFGNYSVTVRSIGPGTIELRREFDIPVQIVAPRDFDSFAQFAQKVDDAERQHLIVQRTSAENAQKMN